MGYGNYWGSKQTPQDRPIPGREADMTRNDAGGYVFDAGNETLFRRFLILGTEGGTYYASERDHTVRAGQAVRSVLLTRGTEAIEEIVKVSQAGRAPSNTPALAALAMASGLEKTKHAAFHFLPRVARTGMHIFQFVDMMESFRGWGRLAREGVARWYTEQDPGRLAYQVLKYQGRRTEERGQRWTHRDLLRLAHPKPPTPAHQAIFRYVTHGDIPDIDDDALHLIHVYERVKQAETADEVIDLIQRHGLTWEFVPGQWLGSPDVWRALLPNLPLTALIRNLGRLSALGVLKPFGREEKIVLDRLNDIEIIRKSRIHPMKIFVAAMQYATGRGLRGSLKWVVNSTVLNALWSAFYDAFQNVEPSGRRILIALDVSGSMGYGRIAGMNITPRDAAAAMAVITARTEPRVHTVAFSHHLREFPITYHDGVQSVVERMDNMSFGKTDCALPMIYAMENGLEVDAFVVYTDNETWAGDVHPVQALQDYRRKTGIPAKLVVVGMTATNFSIADPSDPGMLDVVGLDTATPKLISDFIADRL